MPFFKSFARTPCLDIRMPTTRITDVVEGPEKANADLEPELLRGPDKRQLPGEYQRARRLADFGIVALAQSSTTLPGCLERRGPRSEGPETVATGKISKDRRP